jgi:hypothetical protein
MTLPSRSLKRALCELSVKKMGARVDAVKATIRADRNCCSRRRRTSTADLGPVTPSNSRIAVALSATLLLGACQDGSDPLAPSAPSMSVAAPVTSTAAASNAAAMAMIGADLVADTDLFLVVLESAEKRANINAAIQALADKMTAGDAVGASAALIDARAAVAAVPSEVALYELAPVSLALDNGVSGLTGAAPSASAP